MEKILLGTIIMLACYSILCIYTFRLILANREHWVEEFREVMDGYLAVRIIIFFYSPISSIKMALRQ